MLQKSHENSEPWIPDGIAGNVEDNNIYGKIVFTIFDLKQQILEVVDHVTSGLITRRE